MRKATVPSGETKVILELETTEHGRVSVWLDTAVLRKKFRAELQRRLRERGEAKLEPGETIRLNPGTKRPSRTTPGATVWPFPTVEFEHGVPEETAEELLLADALDSGEAESQDAADALAIEAAACTDDDLPF